MKRIEKIALGVVILGVVVVAAFFVVRGRNASRREAALAAFPIPERVAELRDTKPLTVDPETPAAHESPEASFERVTSGLFGVQTDEWRMLMRAWRRPAEQGSDYWERLEREIAPAQNALAGIRERAAQGGSLGQVTFDRAPDGDFTHLAFARGAVETLEVDAQLAARHDEFDRAVADIMAIMQLADEIADDPVQYSHRTRWDAYRRATGALECIPAGAIPKDQIHTIIDQLSQGDRREAFADSFAGEVLLNKPYFEKPELLVEQYDDWAAYLGVNDPIHVLYNTPLGKPLLDADEAIYLEMTQRMADAAKLPFYEAFGEIAAIQYELHKLPVTRVLARGFLFQSAGSLQQQAEHESRLDIAQLGLALELYHAGHGEYPRTLEPVAQYLPEGLPVDVFTGKPYVYRINVAPFLLYGVGADRADHGGKVPRDYRHEGDIVWRGVVENVPP